MPGPEVTCKTGSIVASLRGDGDKANREYWVDFGVTVEDEETALRSAYAAGLPRPGMALTLGSNKYLNTITGAFNPTNKEVWVFQLEYIVPPKGQEQETQSRLIEDPLLRPPILNIENNSLEYVIHFANPLVDLPHGDGKGGLRRTTDSGPIVNAAGTGPTQAQTDTVQTELLVIRRNFSSLHEIRAINKEFKYTTNKNPISDFEARTLKYFVTKSEGEQREISQDGKREYVFWPGTIMIEVHDEGTDRTLDNVGYDVWDPQQAKVVRYKDPVTKQYPGEKRNLKIDGTDGGDVNSTITWTYLIRKSYSKLFKGVPKTTE